MDYRFRYDGRGVRTYTSEEPIPATGTYVKHYHHYTPDLRFLARTDYSVTGTTATVTRSIETIWFAGLPVAQIDYNDLGTLRYTFTDHLGTPTLQTSSTGSIIWQMEREPYGKLYRVRTGKESAQPLRLPGQEMYQYAIDNPAVYVDPTGLEPRLAWPSTHKRNCDTQDWKECEQKCSPEPALGCVRVWRPRLRGMQPMPRWDFVKGPLECNCKERTCADRLRDLVNDVSDWLDRHTRSLPQLPPFIPLLPSAPAPKPVIPGLPPFFVNPCHLNPSMCYGPYEGGA
jgi:hypothetical protein